MMHLIWWRTPKTIVTTDGLPLRLSTQAVPVEEEPKGGPYAWKALKSQYDTGTSVLYETATDLIFGWVKFLGTGEFVATSESWDGENNNFPSASFVSFDAAKWYVESKLPKGGEKAEG